MEVRSHSFAHFEFVNQFVRYKFQLLHSYIIIDLKDLDMCFIVCQDFTFPVSFRIATHSHLHICFKIEADIELVWVQLIGLPSYTNLGLRFTCLLHLSFDQITITFNLFTVHFTSH